MTEINADNQDGKTFTQADVDRIIAERLSRSKTDKETVAAETTTALLTQLGVDNLDAAKAILEAHKTAEAEKLSAVEKAQRERDEKDAELKKINAELLSVREEGLETARNNAVLRELEKLNVVDADVALMTINTGDVTAFMKDGKPDATVIKTAVEKLKKDKSFLFSPVNSTYQGFKSSAGGGNPDAKEDKLKKAIAVVEGTYKRG